MDPQQVFVLLLLAAVFAAFVWDKLALELVALGGAGLLMITGILKPEALLRCFSNPAPVTIGALFILSASLERTGLINRLGVWFNQHAKGSERRALFLILLICPLVSAFVNNTPLVVILMPVLLGFCRESGAKPTRLLMPLSFATILGGTCSMAGTSTNLLVDGMARQTGLPPFQLFSIAPLGLIYAAIGCAYLWFIAPRLLPARDTLATLLDATRGREFLVQASVPAGSPLVGKPVLDALAGRSRNLRILEVRRRGHVLEESLDAIVVLEGDRLLLRTGTKGVAELHRSDGIHVGTDTPDLAPLEQREAVLLEGMIGRNSPMIGRTIGEIGFRQRFGAIILAMHREGHNITKNFEETRLELGDTLLVEGASEGIERLKDERDFIVLSEPKVDTPHVRKAPLAILGILLFVALASFDFTWIGLPQVRLDTFGAAFIAALVVLLGGCLTPREAYDAVDWRILLLIVGMLGIGEALETTGAAEVLAKSLSAWCAPFGPWVLLSATYFLAMVLTEMISNNAVAVVLTPLVIRLAEAVDASPVPFVVAVMFGASASFTTPIGYQTNTYVFGAGGYRFRDFVKVGLPLNLLLWVTASLLIPWLWPL